MWTLPKHELQEDFFTKNGISDEGVFFATWKLVVDALEKSLIDEERFLDGLWLVFLQEENRKPEKTSVRRWIYDAVDKEVLRMPVDQELIAGTLFLLHKDNVAKILQGQVNSPRTQHDLEDIGQDVWLKIGKTITHVEYRNFYAYLTKICKNEIANYWRKRANSVASDINRKNLLESLKETQAKAAALSWNSSDSRFGYRARRADLFEAMDQAKDNVRKIEYRAFELYYLEDDSGSGKVGRISEKLGISRATVYSYVQLVRTIIRQIIEREERNDI